MIKIEHLYAGYDNKFIINNETFNIENEKINIFIGPNGSGKSTIFKAICNQLRCWNGSINIDNKNISSFSAKDFSKKVGIMFQENIIPSDIEVKKLVSYGRFSHKKIFDELTEYDNNIIDDALTLTGIKEFSNKQMGELSTGQRQLVWISLLIAQEANYLFLDEPISSLDLNNQFEILNCLKKLKNKKHKTIIVILHDINLALQFADKIFVIKNGKIISSGNPNKIITSSLIKDVFNVNSSIIKIKNNPYCIFFN